MLDILLRRGYFPSELPPLFNTETLANAVISAQQSLPACMTKDKATRTQPSNHNLARVGGLRRRLSVPNPVNFYRLARVFDINQVVLETKWAESPFSHTTPSLANAGSRAISPKNPDRATPRAMTRVGTRYLLKADISQFYPSIYTHTIPWVLHTKATAKAGQQDMGLAGNVLDKELQACQHGQTKGIAIGPDTSLGIAELLLSPIDRRMNEECDIKGGVRFIDDMEFSFIRLANAEKALATLEALLHEYELQLNGNKTKIIALPDSIDSLHATELRPYIPKDETNSRTQWTDYFNRAFDLAKVHPEDGVLRYAVAALQSVKISSKTWQLAQSLLWQSIALDPGCLRFVIDVLWTNIHVGTSLSLDESMAVDALDSLISTSAPVGHGSEVVWSLWAAMLFNLDLSTTSWGAITKMDDSFVAVAACVANQHNPFAEALISPLWLSWLEEGCFDQGHWLFAYEAYRNGWLENAAATAKLDTVAACKFMKETGVAFFDEEIISNYQTRTSRFIATSGSGGY